MGDGHSGVMVAKVDALERRCLSGAQAIAATFPKARMDD